MANEIKLNVVKNPLVNHNLAILRDANTDMQQFRAAMRVIGYSLAVAISENFSTGRKSVVTPLESTDCTVISDDIVLLPVLRAGLGLLDPFLELLPFAAVGHIGLQRNEKTLEPEDYYFKSPKNLENRLVLILDPMLATGGSAAAAVDSLKKKGANRIVLVSLIAAPEGVRKMNQLFPDVHIYTAALDSHLNEKGYIVPGLGDAGDRYFGTL
ncbi:MAG: uracil phosphoribosyltransferase [Ignavibacteriaceae bacterium]|nr:uracil phosphoribosyltransferase [Ignavibacteriaceae bacterium]NUM72328.1 uracil phosphoribosyltransferase [Ignavibacteriaceae bacterium]